MRAESGSMSKPKICKHCGDEITRSPPLSPRTCIGCAIARKERPKVTRTVPAYTMTRASTTEGSARPLKTKQPPHRSESLRQSAKGEPCIACGRQDGTTVWAHSNELIHGKGKSSKAHDLLGLYLCSVCHHLLDASPSWTREQKQAFFREHYPAAMVRVAEKLAAGEIKL
jgi:hypothetical protein